MTRKQAEALVRECVDREIQRLAVDANLFERYGATYPAAESASRRRRELRDAWEITGQGVLTFQQPEPNLDRAGEGRAR